MTINQIKHEFLAFRNGIVADTLRKAGYPFSIIFGLQLPQLKEIAAQIGKDKELGLKLWQDENVRESRILALLVLPPEEVSFDEAIYLALTIRSREEADLLPFLLLRHMSDFSIVRFALASPELIRKDLRSLYLEKQDPELRDYLRSVLSLYADQ